LTGVVVIYKKKTAIYTGGVRPAGLKTLKKLQPNHSHENFLLLTVLLLFAQCKAHYW
jgi:hypothetical protein